jgi:hypothetical protein
MRSLIFLAAFLTVPVLLAAAYLRRRETAPVQPRVDVRIRARACPHDHGERYASGGVEWCGDCGRAMGAIEGVS